MRILPRQPAPASLVLASVCPAGCDNVLCLKSTQTDLVVLRKCYFTGLHCRHWPEHFSCAGFDFLFGSFVCFLLLDVNCNNCIYAIWLHCIPLLKMYRLYFFHWKHLFLHLFGVKNVFLSITNKSPLFILKLLARLFYEIKL